MKVTDLRRKLIASLVAGGMLAPGAVHAANLNENLVINGDFETVDINTVMQVAGSNPPTYGVKILGWTAGSQMGFAYSHDGSSSINGVVPDYADGADPAGAGHWYFSSNLTNPDINDPGEFSQDINVSGGASGTVIAQGTGGFSVSAWMSSYDTNSDFGNVHLDFRNSVGSSLGTALLSDSDPGPSNVWNLNTGTGAIPIGTATVRLSVYGTAVNGGPDGYMDNVSFQVTNVLPALSLTIDRDTGTITLDNLTGAGEAISGYSITSAFEGLAPANWRSITDNYDAGSPGPNQVDAVNDWTELTVAPAHSDLSEADFESGDGAVLANGRSVSLGNLNTWIKTPTEDLVFQYVSGGQVVDGVILWVGNGGDPFEVGDLNTNGVINSADWTIFRNNQHADLNALSLAEAYRAGDLTGDRLNNHADFVAFKSAYEVANGGGSFALMLSNVPEPSSIVLVLASGLLALPLTRRSKYRK
jgi:hypothetical protein